MVHGIMRGEVLYNLRTHLLITQYLSSAVGNGPWTMDHGPFFYYICAPKPSSLVIIIQKSFFRIKSVYVVIVIGIAH
jgi:hypothetical protein